MRRGSSGAWLAERLLDAGARVVVLRRDVPADSRFRIEGIEQRCDVVLGDLIDYEALLRVLNEYDVTAVFHLAAQTIVGTANRSPLSTWEIEHPRHLHAARGLPRASASSATPVERSSSPPRTRPTATRELPYREDFPLQARYPYDVSKACTDMIARSYAVTSAAGGGHPAGERLRRRRHQLVAHRARHGAVAGAGRARR